MFALQRRYILVFILAIIIILVLASDIMAVDNFQAVEKALDNQSVNEFQSPNLFLNFIKLIFILGLIIAAAWSIIRLLGKKVSNHLRGTWIHVVDEVVLGQNRGIVLCEVGERIYAIGVTDHNISLLFEIDNPKLLEEISQNNASMSVSGPPPRQGYSWKEIITGIFQPRKPVSGNYESFHTLMIQQAQRLEDLSNQGTYSTKSRRSDSNE